MALTQGSTVVVSSILALLTFSAMQVFKTFLASSQLMTFLGGFAGSLLFVFLLTAVGNLEKTVFGHGFQTQLAEVVFCQIVAMAAAASVHRVCATTCILFSVAMTWTLHRISQETYSAGGVTGPVAAMAKKKK
jgi:hypothetical protein